MKSGGQIDGQISSQSPVVWWYREVNCEVVEICVEAIPVLGAEKKFTTTLQGISKIALQYYSILFNTLIVG
jgi:hypothetical protein